MSMAVKDSLIYQYFDNPKPYTPYYNNYTQPSGKGPWLENSAPSSGNMVTTMERTRAERRNLTVEEYRKRVDIVNKEAAKCHFKLSDVVVPANPKDEAKYGKMFITGITRHFDDYGTVDWTDPPMILAVRSLKDSTINMTCAVNWLKPAREATICHQDAC